MHHPGMFDTTQDTLVVSREKNDAQSLVQTIIGHSDCPRLIPPVAESSKAFLRLPDRNRRNPRFLSFVAQKDPVFLARLLCMTTQIEYATAGRCATNAEEAISILGVATSISIMQEVANARERHLIALKAANLHLENAAQLAAHDDQSLDLFAEELRLTQERLNSITGEFTSDDLLGVIFSRFCIGK
jgi:hypothetical protein